MGRDRKILCVDDDCDDRYLLSEAIKEVAPHLEVVEAENGLAALSILEEAKQSDSLPCLVVLDINMPLLDGRQTLDRIQKDVGLQNLNVVVFTSSENPNDNAFFKSKGVQFVTKPFDHHYFAPIVKGFLNFCV